MKVVKSDIFRATVCRIHATLDELFGILAVSFFRFLATQPSTEDKAKLGYEAHLTKVQFVDLIHKHMEVSVAQHAALYEHAIRLTQKLATPFRTAV